MAEQDIRGAQGCLADEALTAWLEGALTPERMAASETHLAECTECRETLALLMRLLNRQGQPVSAGEEAELAAINSEWKGRPDPLESQPTNSRGMMGILGIAVVVIFGVLDWAYNSPPREPKSASAIVQLLLNEGRPIEARLNGQPYHPWERTRAGRESASLDYDLVNHRLMDLKADPYSMGRFYLLTGDFDRSIPLLEEAAAQPDASPGVLNDLGAAYLSRGDAASLRRAERELKRALDTDARLAPAVFNLALLYEKLGDADGARAEWQRYLLLDSESGWSGDARTRLR